MEKSECTAIAQRVVASFTQISAAATDWHRHLSARVREALEHPSPVDTVVAALEGAGALLQERRELARQRQTIIAANPELRERELIKLASLASRMADALRRRGVGEPAASLTAEAGIAVFKIAFERWVSETHHGDLPQLIRASLDELKAVIAGKPNGQVAKRRPARVTRSPEPFLKRA